MAMASTPRLAAAAWALALGLLVLASPARAANEDSGAADRSEDSRTDARGSDGRSGYSYLRLVTGDATVNSRWNGRVDARRNMPISTGDEIVVSDAGRVEVGLADGNILHVGGGTRAQFTSLSLQQGESDEFSAVRLREGSVVLAAIGQNADRIPRIDTDDATVYLSPGARVRVNADSRRGTVVIGRFGSAEVRTRTGSYRLRAGQYLMVRGEEEPDIERGPFSRDRFDLWAADRMDALSGTRIASARYVDEEYATDVDSLDNYGDWTYSPTYATNVWTPHVDIGWTPYSFGTWYYTPAGLTWWSYDPWGWYPFHYGNWFFEASLNQWCWAPASVYSPAWVYWAYTPSYVGWCPIGLYSGFGPWWDTYYRQSGLTRANLYVSLHGTFNPRQVNFRGWNFTGSNALGGGVSRADIIPGSRIGGRLGTAVAITSRPIVVNARPGEGREAIRDYIREAPRAIERTATGDSSRLAPILARERNLPAASVDALRERAVVAERGRLSGSTAGDLAPRGSLTTDRGRAVATSTDAQPGKAPEGPAATHEPIVRGRVADATAPRGDDRATAARSAEEWRSRGRAVNPASPAGAAAPGPASERPASERSLERSRPERGTAPPGPDWRTNAKRIAPGSAQTVDTATNPRSGSEREREDDWRSREVPPVRRVVEGAVPSRTREGESLRPRPARADAAPRPDSAGSASRTRTRPEGAPAAPRVESHPAPRVVSRPAAPAPRPERDRKDH